MKNFLIKLTLLIIPIFFVIGIVNYNVDPANILSKNGIESEMAAQLLSGNNVGGVSNYDERLLQKQYAEGLEESTHFLVLGSSRTMVLNQSQFDRSFYNASVSGAGLEDLLAIYYLFDKNNVTPKHVLLGVDPWILNANNVDTRYKSLEQEYESMKSIITGTDFAFLNSSLVPENMKQILSLSYFQNSISSIGKTELSQTKMYATNLDEDEGVLRLSDGSIVYDIATREISEDEVNEIAAQAVIGKSSYKIDDFYTLDITLQNYFEQFVKYLLSKDIKVTLIIPPYHPIAYEKFKKEPYFDIVFEAEEYFFNIAKEYNVEVIGSYNPDVLGLTEKDFYDEQHMKTIPILLAD